MMKNILPFWAWALLCLVACSSPEKPARTCVEMHQNWEFRQVGTTEWLPAQVPGTVHTDLLAAGKIPDPYFRDNEQQLQWIGERDWEYRTRFNLPEEVADKPFIALAFDGLDTYADVYLNDSLLGSSDNMFVGYRFRCEQFLKKGENELRLYFHSPLTAVDSAYRATPFQYPADNEHHPEKRSVFARKAPYHYGWDWGPRYVTSGIWRPVRLEGCAGGRLVNNRINYTLDENRAYGKARIEVRIHEAGTYRYFLASDSAGISSTPRTFELKPGDHTLELDFICDHPSLWWPNGMGAQVLYPLQIGMEKDGRLLDIDSVQVGFRTIEVVNEPDSIGQSFFVKVNGRPVFMKGVNYIPSDVFLPRVTPQKQEQLLDACVDANMNMVRVWGGGVYESDHFYDLCDQKGLLVWQDFMFACTLYPGDKDFLRRVEEEAIYNIERLVNHPSLALWCGNNEINVGWFNWGWQQSYGYTPAQQVELRKDYVRLFEELLPKLVREHSPKHFYMPSSPISNWGKIENFRFADNHYWGVWHGKEPFENYNVYVPRFMSEYGFQSFPSMAAMQRFSLPEDWGLDTPVMKVHQKSSMGNGLIKTYMDRDYREPKDFASFLYLSQVLQARGMKIAIEAHRRSMPFCMGTLYWQLNDAWPAASWSSIDYYGNWKAAHYAVKNAFAPQLLSLYVEDGQLKVYGIHEGMDTLQAELRLRLLDFEGRELRVEHRRSQLQPNTSTQLAQYDPAHWRRDVDSTAVVLHAALHTSDGVLAEQLYYFAKPKDLNLPKHQLSMQLLEEDGRTLLELQSPVLLRNVYITAGEKELRLQDNFFDLLPGQAKQIEVLGSDSLLQADGLEDILRVTSLQQAMK